MSDEEHTIDFAVAASRGEVEWRVEAVPVELLEPLETVQEVVDVLRQLTLDASEVLGLVSVAEDFFILVRAREQGTRLLLSDVTAAREWPLAQSVLDFLGLPAPDVEDDHVEAAGDLAIFADLGLAAMELDAMCTDLDLYPDEVLGSVAARLGFGEDFERASTDAMT